MPEDTATARPCHDHSQDVGFSAIHLDEALYTIGRWVLMEKPGPEAVARRLLAMRIELASVRAMRVADRWIEEATAFRQREADEATRKAAAEAVYDQEADGGISG